MQFVYLNSQENKEQIDNPFYGCFFIQYQEAGFCTPGTCEEHTFLPKPIVRVDSKKYRNMYFFSSQASKSGIFKKPQATHWGIYDLPNHKLLFSDVMIHDNTDKVYQHTVTEFKHDDQTFYLKVRFTSTFMDYKITPHKTFTDALRVSAAI